jgi:predicted nucleotidyltransferase
MITCTRFLGNRKMDTAFQVPTIDIRERIPFEVIDEIARQIADRFQPQKIILFGSYAYGSPRPESDVDVLVVMKTPLREIQQAQQIRQYLNLLFGLDLLVYTPENLAKRIEWGDTFLGEIVSRGKVLYESIDA